MARYRYGAIPDTHNSRDREFAHLALNIPVVPTSLDYRDAAPPILDQGDEGCHSDDTEVLTPEGWVRWPDWKPEVELGTVNPVSHVLEFQRATAVHAYDYAGPLHRTDRRGLSFAVTPSHRMWVRSWNESIRTLDAGFSFVTAERLGWYAGLLAAPRPWLGADLERVRIGRRSYEGDDFVALVALVVSDGWVGGTASNPNTVSFCCFREDRLSMVRGLAERLGLHEVPARPGVWKWSDEALAEWLRQHAYDGTRLRSPFKRVPSLIRATSARQMALFLDYFGDQHLYEDGHRQFSTTSQRLGDDLQELLLRIGHRGSIGTRPPRESRMADGRVIRGGHDELTVTERATGRLSLERKREVFTEPYRGAVYCATVPNGLLVTRHHDAILISGNSCTAFGEIHARRLLGTLWGRPIPPLSQQSFYWHERRLEHTVDQDAGAMPRDGLRVLRKIGCDTDVSYPYVVGQYAKTPPPVVLALWAAAKIKGFYRCHFVMDVKVALTAKHTVVCGFQVFPSFESPDVARTGVMSMPAPREAPIGGHLVAVDGFHDGGTIAGVPDLSLICANSWSVDWGARGYFFMPYEYVNPEQALVSDLWALVL